MELPEEFDDAPDEVKAALEKVPKEVIEMTGRALQLSIQAKVQGTKKVTNQDWEPEWRDEDLETIGELIDIMKQIADSPVVLDFGGCTNPLHDHPARDPEQMRKEARNDMLREFHIIGGPAVLALVREVQMWRAVDKLRSEVDAAKTATAQTNNS